MLTLEQHDTFSFGFELGWLFLDLFLGYYTLRIGDIIKFEMEE